MEGRRLSHFEITSELGKGGMGVVYLARDLALERQVALKVLHSDVADDPERLARFVREARTAAAITHPNIATVHEIDNADGVAFIAMEYVDGRTLRQVLATGAMSTSEIVRIATEIASGLTKAHESGVVHRDLKPDNVMITGDGHVKILDFGLAKLVEPEGESAAESSGDVSDMATVAQTLTREGKVFGTAAFMSPEQARGKPLDARSDIFSFGVMLYQMCTGALPFRGETTTDTITAILRDPATPAIALNPDVPIELDRIVARCLGKRRRDRYQSSRDLLHDLRQLQGSGETSSLSSTPAYATGRHHHEGYTSGSTGGGPAAPSDSLTPAPPAAPARSVPGARVLMLAVLLVALLGALAIGWRSRAGGGRVADAGPNALAVHLIDNLKDPGDPERYGQILQELIITDLADVPDLRVLSSQRLYDLQKQLTGDDRRVYQADVATAVARRAGAQSMITGSLSRLGERWLLTCQLVDIETGAIRVSRRIDGEDLFAMVDELTDGVRDRLALEAGVSPSAPVRDKTTASLVAYQLYLEGREKLNDNEFAVAVALLDSALTIDPSFAKARYSSALAHWWAGDDPSSARRPLAALLEGDAHVSARERGFAEATLALVERDYERAEEAFSTLVEEYPDQKDAWYGLGEAQFHKPDPDHAAAHATFTRAAELDPDFLLAYRHLYDIYDRWKEPEKALSLARSLFERDTTSVERFETWLSRATATGDTATVTRSIREAVERFPASFTDTILVAIRADVARRIGDYPRAVALYEHFLDDYPDHPRATGIRRSLGALYVTLRDERRGEVLLRQAMREDRGTDARQRMIQLLGQEGRFADGYAFVDSFGLGPNLPAKTVRPYVDLFEGYFLTGLGRLDSARVHLERGLRTIPDDQSRWELTALVGWGYLSIGHHAVADSIFASATEHRSARQGEALAGRAWSQILLQNYAEAERVLTSPSAEWTDAHGALPLLYERVERFDDAVTAAREAVENDPNDLGSYVSLYKALRARGDEAAADSVAEVALDRFDHPPSRRWLMVGQSAAIPVGFAWAELFAGHADRAAAWIDEAGALDPTGDDPDVWLARGSLALSRRAFDEADVAYETAARSALPVSYDSYRAAVGRVLVALETERFADAESIVRLQLEHGPYHVRLYQLLAYALAGQQRYDDAERAARRALAHDADRTNLSLLAWILIAGDIDVDGGTDLAARALERDPTLPGLPGTTYAAPAEQALGLAALKRRRFAEAVELLETARDRVPARASISDDLERARKALAASQG